MKNSLQLPLSLLLLSLAGACGNAAQVYPNPFMEALRPDGSNINGAYQAELFRVNVFPDNNPGSASMIRKNDIFAAHVKFKGVPGAGYRQDIYSGRCPTVGDNTNGDLYIDNNEAKKVIGKVYIPLDSDIDTQSQGRWQYPRTDNNGNYEYKREASFERMFSDLRNDDRNEDDELIKIDPNQGFTLVGKIVLIQAISGTQPMPVACGQIIKIFNTPEVFADVVGSDNNRPPRVETPVPAPTSTTTTPPTTSTPPSTTTTSTTNSDGSVTTTTRTTHSDGSVTTTTRTTHSDGSVTTTTRTTHSDGRVTTTTRTSSGTSTTTPPRPRRWYERARDWWDDVVDELKPPAE